MQFYLKPPYKTATIVLFRLFFAANLVGAAQMLVERIARYGGKLSDYLAAAEIGTAMIAVTWGLVRFVEWMNRKLDRFRATRRYSSITSPSRAPRTRG